MGKLSQDIAVSVTEFSNLCSEGKLLLQPVVKMRFELDTVAHTYNPSTGKAGTYRIIMKLKLAYSNILSQKRGKHGQGGSDLRVTGQPGAIETLSQQTKPKSKGCGGETERASTDPALPSPPPSLGHPYPLASDTSCLA